MRRGYYRNYFSKESDEIEEKRREMEERREIEKEREIEDLERRLVERVEEDSHLTEDDVARVLYDANFERNVEQMRRLAGIKADFQKGNLARRNDDDKSLPKSFMWPREMLNKCDD